MIRRGTDGLPMPFSSYVGMSETLALEVRGTGPKSEAADPRLLVEAVVLAFHLLEFPIVGGGAAALMAEPRWLSMARTNIPVPLMPRGPSGMRTLELASLSRILAMAGKAQQELAATRASPAAAALRRFTSGVTRADARDAIVDFVIALESLFLPRGPRGEMGFRFTVNGAAYLAERREERMARFAFLRELYEARSAVVHGSYMGPEARKSAAATAKLCLDARALTGAALRKALDDGWPDQAMFTGLLLDDMPPPR